MKRHSENSEKMAFLKVALGSEREDLHFLIRRQLVISVQDDSNKRSLFFSRTTFLKKCSPSWDNSCEIFNRKGGDGEGKLPGRNIVNFPLSCPQGWGHCGVRTRFSSTLVSYLVT